MKSVRVNDICLQRNDCVGWHAVLQSFLTFAGAARAAATPDRAKIEYERVTALVRGARMAARRICWDGREVDASDDAGGPRGQSKVAQHLCRVSGARLKINGKSLRALDGKGQRKLMRSATDPSFPDSRTR